MGRNLLCHLRVWLYGKHYSPPQYDVISWLFLRFMGLLYFSAFASFGVQALGLIGRHGIIPVTDLIITSHGLIGDVSYWALPMVFWLNASDFFIQAVCWIGALSSLLLVFNRMPRFNLVLLYLLYLSLVSAGQMFMTFQWDTFLLEAGILSLFLVRYRTVGIWLLRFLLFRFMFEGGMVKLFSGDPSWPAFTALYQYFATEPLPTTLGWYADHLPHFVLSFMTATTLVIEVVMPFFIFMPRRLRFLAAFAILTLQLVIMLTGNYNFFNLQTMALCVVLFDDAAILKCIPQRWSSFMRQRVYAKPHSKKANTFVACFVVFTVFLSVVQFTERFVGNVPAPFVWLNNLFMPFRLVGTYGPFAVITYPRYEIVVEGSDDGDNWKEYEFKYKPGDISRRPEWIIPHQPRLDWQMWFAALSTPNDNPWFSQFLTRILENSPTVLALLKTNPFPDHAPLYVRAEFYRYRFTTLDEKRESGAWWDRELIGIYFPSAKMKSIFDR